MNKIDFIEYVKEQIKPHNIKLYISNGNQVNCEGSRVQGYSCISSRVMAVANGAKVDPQDMFEVLIHEYCHFEQWLEQSKSWVDSEDNLVNESWYSILDGRIDWHKDFDYSLQIIINLELDCEKRVLRIIDKFDLPVDKTLYAKKANSYLYFYSYLKECRSWYSNNNAPYKNEKIYNLLPSTLKSSYKKIPKDLLDEFRRHYE